MDETIKVGPANCEAVAQRLVAFLRDKTFSVTALGSKTPKVITDLSLYKGPFPDIDLSGNGYRYADGRLTILLHPHRVIFWDVEAEGVTVVFLENQCVILEKSMPPLLARVLIVCSCPEDA